MTRNLKIFEKYLVTLLLFLLPTQLAFHFWPSWAFVFGIRVDFLSPGIYLTDVLIVLLVILKIFTDWKNFTCMTFKRGIYLVPPLILIVLNCTYSASPAVSVYKWIKVVEFSFFAYYFFKEEMFNLSSIVRVFFYSGAVISLIGIFQFIKGGTVGGILYFLGERSFNMGTPGIALVGLYGVEHLRAYSTFSHPNSLAGFLGAVTLFILLSGKLKKNIFNFIGVCTMLICFLLSFSIAGYIGMFLVFSFYLFSKNRRIFKWVVSAFLLLSIAGSLLLPILSPWILKTFPLVGQNIGQRLDLAFISGQMIGQKFLIGEGLGTFIVNIPAFKGIFSYSWLLQPVHNIFLLVFSEIGIFGLLAFCFLIYRTLVNQLKTEKIFLLLPLVFILFTGLFDHYWLTLQQNLLLVSILFGLSLTPSHEK